ncbi:MULTISPECIES: LysR family transcriptional regulator [Allobacillus]|uniref:LysR family transcriptional regulator n=1 Tax=Allobacillus salarius TaxID=1955272 RepID=A0A556PN66_9BACI|nr:LysR family transcriptional regulator [Allobacillus salarius]TSJ65821.1 LysR family transcriptional regulator [Allobacillus salarius]
MDTRQLRYYVALIEAGTYTKAAEQLHISQPSLSATIKKLEESVGLTLINRGSRSLHMTHEGKILYEEARRFLQHFQHVTDEMERLKQQGPLEISIGLIESTIFFVPEILKQFKQEYEEAKVSLMETLSLSDVERALYNFDIHLAITNQNIFQNDIETLPIYEEKLVTLIPSGHRLANKRTIQLHDLENESFIVCKEGFQTRQDILNAFNRAGVQPNIQFEIERFETSCSLVEKGLGITVVPENYVTYSKHTNLVVKSLAEDNISRTVYLAYVNNRYMPPIVKRFIEMIETYFK